MNALGDSGINTGKDPLMSSPRNITRKYNLISNDKIFNSIKTGAFFVVPKRLRFRKEDGFYLVNIRWANIITLDNETAEFLINYQNSRKLFTLMEFGSDKLKLLAQLYFKDAVESGDLDFKKIQKDQGVSADLINLPQCGSN